MKCGVLTIGPVVARSESDEAIQKAAAETFWIAPAFVKASADKSRSLSSGRADPSARDDGTATRVFSFPRHDLPGFCSIIALERQRAQGMPGVWCTRGLVCSEKSTRVRNHRYAETFRHSLRDGLRLIARSPRCAGLDSHRREQIIHSLDSSVGESGPRDFTVRIGRVRQLRQCVHRIPHQHS